MQRVLEGLGIAAILVLVAVANTGCSAIGYFVGGAIDGPAKTERESVSVNHRIDSAGREHLSLDLERLTSLAKKARPGEGFVVEVMTRDQLYKRDGFTIDTAFTVKGDSIYRWTEGLHRGDLVLPNPSGRFVHVPGLVLGQESPPHFIPLREVQWIDASGPAENPEWGTGRTIGLVVGVALDTATVYAIVNVIGNSIRLNMFSH